MQTRKLGYTDLHLTTVGFGAASIGGGRDYGNRHRDDAEGIATVHAALDLGINWIDVAPKYGNGHGEELVGRALAERSERVIVATKCGNAAARRWQRLYVAQSREHPRGSGTKLAPPQCGRHRPIPDSPPSP